MLFIRISKDPAKKTMSMLKSSGIHNHYLDNLLYLREVGISYNKAEQFNFSNPT